MRAFDMVKVVIGSETNALMFTCGIKPCSTTVQRYKVQNFATMIMF